MQDDSHLLSYPPQDDSPREMRRAQSCDAVFAAVETAQAAHVFVVRERMGLDGNGAIPTPEKWRT